MKNKKIATGVLVGVLSVLTSMTAFAGQWIQDSKGWWYQNDDGSYPVSTWKLIDGNNDSLCEWYYFDSEGWLVTNTIIDGHTVDENGARVVDGEVLRLPGVTLYSGGSLQQTPNETTTPEATVPMEQVFEGVQEKYRVEAEVIRNDPEV